MTPSTSRTPSVGMLLQLKKNSLSNGAVSGAEDNVRGDENSSTEMGTEVADQRHLRTNRTLEIDEVRDACSCS